ncbi:hypothetical protein SARC_09118, partial [Sphaeroforma arctica JP610]
CWGFNMPPLPHDVWGTFIDHKVCSGVLVAILILTPMYIIGHRVLTRYSAVYVKLVDDQQLVVLHHTIEVVVLGNLFAPMTYLILSLNLNYYHCQTSRSRCKS